MLGYVLCCLGNYDNVFGFVYCYLFKACNAKNTVNRLQSLWRDKGS
jgi:hypothetical protein